MFGANPPSSPTLVLYPFFFNTDFNVWKISTPHLKPSLKEEAPTGIIMNSWKSILLSACAPPFKMFIIGIGNVFALVPPIYLKSGSAASSAAAFATAILTASIALAPSLLLLGVPSSAISASSIAACCVISKPTMASDINVFTFFTAFKTPLPTYFFLSLSRSSTAS